MILQEYGRSLKPEEWSPVIELLMDARNVVLTTHENSDGDGLGCEVALAQVLTMLGKEVLIINPTEVPPNYTFLSDYFPISLFDPSSEEDMQNIALSDLVVLLDANLRDRMGSLWSHVSFARDMGTQKLLCIDHHLEPDDFTDVMVCEHFASSTGELVYGLVHAMEVKLGRSLFSPLVAAGLYVAIMTDTGSFRFPKTSPYVHRIAGELLSKGADSTELYDRIYNSLTPTALKLLGVALSAIRILDDGKISWLFISQEMLKSTASKLFDTDLIIRYLLSVPSVRIAVLIVELQDGRSKVSFRSRGKIYVNQLAKKYGGGGHMNAAGSLFSFSAEKVQQVLLPDIREFLAAAEP